MIYVITTFEKVSKDSLGYPEYGCTRSVAWYSNYDDALDAVTNNYFDIWETCYDYAVLETLPEGLYPITYDGYKAEYFKYDHSNNKYLPIDASEVEICKNILQTWSIG